MQSFSYYILPTLLQPLRTCIDPSIYSTSSTDKMASRVYTVSIGIGHARPNTPQHWVLITYPVGSFNCTYYHTAGGARDKGSYTARVEANKRLDSFAFASVRRVCYIPEVTLGEVIDAARNVKPVQSQRYVLEILRRLENKDVIPGGTTRMFERRFEERCGMPVIIEE
jgi:hypothetical protein